MVPPEQLSFDASIHRAWTGLDVRHCARRRSGGNSIV
jgi:hypothetical protein